MNFDDLQKKWNEEPLEGISVPNEIAVMKQAQTPIDKVRKRMRKDFYLQMAMIVSTVFLPYLFDFSDLEIKIFIVFYGTMLAFTAYYFYKFIAFYKKSYDLSFDSRKNLLWFYYELKLNMELYKAFTYILFFIGFSFGLLEGKIMKSQGTTVPFLENIRQVGNVKLIIALIVAVAFAFAIAEIFPRLTYGKELKKVKKVLDELEED